jgi:aryl-alcohol dehydrogenase-like predicted oxidoreductase
VDLAKETGFSASQIALAWCLANPNVSTVITGASRVEQIHENMKALNAVSRVKTELKDRLDKIFPAT